MIAGWNGWSPSQNRPAPTGPRQMLGRLSDPRSLRRLLVACTVGLVVLALTKWPVAGLAAAAASIVVPRIVNSSTAGDRIGKLEALEQWTRRLADMLTAGRGLEQAIESSATRNVPAPIAPQVRTLARRLTVTRMPTEQAVRLFAEELDDPVADRIVAALILVARRRGTGASAVLNGLAELVARDVTDRREVEAARAEHRTTVRWVIGILLVLTTAAVCQRSYVQPFDTALGQGVLAVIAACYAGAFTWLHRLGRPDIGRRFLAGPPASADREGT
ncbi:type II secretion system F family protein [Spirillospora sp. NPDC052269]